ncbi:heme biosynthesis HemY N-terminal domain-containing protein [Ideonella paludis]|uniref:Heme biosynthesis protein HemY n=1 Tax=Ideonella paludis TaxID=1233411 RepID=A0ABS5E196_9BURK|nr:heme biosynthesis HemY N-terminal domain-containing protein [Ideonella paludis]MBQ0937079.1 heme biosynthesis protein HemY [Ideonella paludis]
MRGVIWLILLFTVAVVSASVLGPNDGLVSIYQGAWRVDLSLNLFLLLLVAAVVLTFVAFQAISGLLALPTRAQAWREQKRERAAHAALREALTELFAARYARAQRAADQALLLQSHVPELAREPQFTTLAQLIAASSLHQLQDRLGRESRLASALASGRQAGGSSADGAQLLAAQWALDDRDAERSLALLSALPPGVARRTQALRLKLSATRQQRKPLDALQTARLLAKHQGFSALAAKALLRSLAIEALEQSLDEEQLRRTWAALDAANRKDAFVVARAARRAKALGQVSLGRDWLQPLWEQMPRQDAESRHELALALVDCAQGLGSDWLPRVEAALSAHGHDAALLAAAGAAFEQRQLWGKAKRPLEQTAASDALPKSVRRQALRSLASIARSEGDEDKAVALERRAAFLE